MRIEIGCRRGHATADFYTDAYHINAFRYQEGFTYDVAENDFDYPVTLVTGVNKTDYFNMYLRAVSES